MSIVETRILPALRSSGRALVGRWSREFGHEELASPAIVFSPHPDDETLGCGGTILRKKHAGAKVTVVFMTDGSASHDRFIPGEELQRLRRREALDACTVLGVPERDVFFLDFKDGRLEQFQAKAVRAVAALLPRLNFSQVFVPYAGDTTADHKATRSVVLRALEETAMPATVYEYPVWFWRQWPWASVPVYSRQDLAFKSMNAFLCWGRAIKDLRWSVQIGDLLETKRAALGQHRTQTQRLIPDSAWPVLSDVSGGEFLDCFFQQQEVFYRYSR